MHILRYLMSMRTHYNCRRTMLTEISMNLCYFGVNSDITRHRTCYCRITLAIIVFFIAKQRYSPSMQVVCCPGNVGRDSLSQLLCSPTENYTLQYNSHTLSVGNWNISPNCQMNELFRNSSKPYPGSRCGLPALESACEILTQAHKLLCGIFTFKS